MIQGLKDSPHYLVLVKQSESSEPELYYLPQKHLEAKDNVEVHVRPVWIAAHTHPAVGLVLQCSCENLLIANYEFLLCSQLLETRSYPIYSIPYEPHEKQTQSVDSQFCLQMTKCNK